MRRWSIFIVIVCSAAAYSQDQIPRPYAFGALDGGGGGFQMVSEVVGGGVQINSKHYILDFGGSYENARKVNDNDQPNPSGHERYLGGSVYYRLGSQWFFGAGAEWSQLATANYKKTAARPTFGGGRDFFTRDCAEYDCRGDFTMRLTVDYETKGNDWQNGVQGPLISFYMPSPSLRKHFFFVETFGVYRFYTTVTEPTNQSLTAEQMSEHQFMGSAQMGLMYRF